MAPGGVAVFGALVALAASCCEEGPHPRARLLRRRACLPRWQAARCAPARRAARYFFAHNACEKAAAVGAGAAVECVGQVICLMSGAPYRHAPAAWAQVHGPLSGAVPGRPPSVVGRRAGSLANIAHNHASVVLRGLVAHWRALVAVARHSTVPLAAPGENICWQASAHQEALPYSCHSSAPGRRVNRQCVHIS